MTLGHWGHIGLSRECRVWEDAPVRLLKLKVEWIHSSWSSGQISNEQAQPSQTKRGRSAQLHSWAIS